MMICCSDSRVMPHWLTDSGPGDLFVLRNAGNIVPRDTDGSTGETATIGYAAAALPIKEIIVCGHSDCGAMKALLHPNPGTPPLVQKWVDKAQPAFEKLEGPSEDVSLDNLVEANVRLQLENLRTLPKVQRKEEDGDLRLTGWVYDIGSGVVRELNPDADSFEPILGHRERPTT